LGIKSVAVKLSRDPYPIRIANGILQDLPAQLLNADLRPPYLVVTQSRILKATSPNLPPGFHVAAIPNGERAKTFLTVGRLIDAMVKHNLTRQSTVVALGGGVVGDVAGFAASIFMRGIALVQVPTTLLAQVDSSIGGKTGVNHRVAKNLIGTFYQPRLVLMDPSVLQTLPEREYRSGLYEAAKYGIIDSPSVFRQFENSLEPLLNRELASVEHLVHTSAAIKAKVVAADEKEGDLRRILNFGHTVGHGIEAAGNYRRLTHGESVGYGMIAAARIALAMGRLRESERHRIETLIRAIGTLPTLRGLQRDKILDAIQHDKKVRDGKIHFILPRRIGEVEITPDVPLTLVREVVQGLLDESRRSH
jgi:3-dehydroquinate synthase